MTGVRPQQPIPEQTGALVRDVIQALEDGRKGFFQASKKLEEDGNEELSARMRQLAEQRQRLSDELKDAASSHMKVADGKGTATGAIHRGWMALADALTGHDPHAVLAVAEQGEDHAKAVYEKVLREDLPDDLQSVLDRQASEVIDAHDEVRDLRDAYA